MAQPLTICRCCLREGCYKDISNEYYYCGQKEVYADLLLDTFNVSISYKTGGGPSSQSRLICDGCITRLRDAVAFKKQVLHSEFYFTQHLDELTSKGAADLHSIVIKSEITNQLETDSLFDNASNISEQITDFKNEIKGDLEFNDCMDKDATEGFDNEGQLLFISTVKENTKPKRQKSKVKKKIIKHKLKNKENGDLVDMKTSNGSPEKTKKVLKTSSRELNIRLNTSKLVTNSNMCLFKSLKTKYRCFFCTEQFLEITNLRDHILNLHNDVSLVTTIVKRSSSYKNAEISDLKCRICSVSIESIENLQKHLTNEHKITFFDTNHLLVPFSLISGFTCTMCNTHFNTFSRLNVHMHTHFTNHVCENCGVSFINKASLRLHVAHMHTEKICPFCSLKFPKTYDVIRHVKKEHNVIRKRKRYCLICGEIFKYTHQLNEHKIQKHGFVRKTACCVECNKTFLSEQNLRIHIRSVHLKERKYTCDLCSMGFFTSTDKKRHEKTHDVSVENLLSCDFCETKFKSKDSWRRHTLNKHSKVA